MPQRMARRCVRACNSASRQSISASVPTKASASGPRKAVKRTLSGSMATSSPASRALPPLNPRRRANSQVSGASSAPASAFSAMTTAAFSPAQRDQQRKGRRPHQEETVVEITVFQKMLRWELVGGVIALIDERDVAGQRKQAPGEAQRQRQQGQRCKQGAGSFLQQARRRQTH